jgi:hypothetical protein
VGAPSSVYRGWGFSALFMVLGGVLFSDVDDRKLKARNRKTESKTGPKNRTLPIHQNREGWGTHFKTFGKGWATRRLGHAKPPIAECLWSALAIF